MKLSVYKEGQEVMYMVYDAIGSTKEDWLTPARILDSTYTDILPDETYKIFSITG